MLRKMLRQVPRHRRAALEHAGLEISLAEFGFHRAADLLPFRGAGFRVDTAIGENLDVAVGQQEINQHAVIVRSVPNAQMRKNIQGTIAGRLVAQQRRAIQRAFDDETDLAGMGRLARLDRALDGDQHMLRKHLSDPPAVLEQMLGDTLDAHAHQLPDAPPPPKLPPPPLNPPLSLELLPLENPPPPLLTHPPGPPEDIMASLNMVTRNAMAPPIADNTSGAAMNQR